LLALGLLSAIWLRNGPGDHRELSRDREEEKSSFTFIEALKTPAFWVWGLTSALYLMIASATSLFTELMLRERGLGPDTFRAALATTALVGILANFGGGFLGARRSLQKLLSISTLFLFPCLIAFPFLKTPLHAIVWAAGLGAAGGVVTVVFFAIWGKSFGPAHLGRIQGVAQALTVLGSAIGPLVFAASVERTGSYSSAFLLFAPLSLVAAAACWWVKAPA
jgi:cyanate permease